MSILIIAPYSHPSPCGIWRRVYLDAKALQSSEYNVNVFSSNIIKGTNNTSSSQEEFERINIYRFPVKFKLGGTSMFFFFRNKLKEINSDIIHVHGYRHPHSLQGVILGKLMKKKVILTSHGPFYKDPNRSVIMKFIDIAYDWLIGWWELKLYSQIIAIAEWEIPELIKRGAPKSKIVLIPNGIDPKFENTDISSHKDKKNSVLYMGRVDSVKRVEKIVEVAKNLPEINFTIYGPQQDYSFPADLPSNLKIIDKSYTADEFIQESKKYDIFILPSVRESFGIVGLEAMSQGLILISSRTLGVGQYLKDQVNGFYADTPEEIEDKIKYVYNNWDNISKIREQAKLTTQGYSQKILGEELKETYKNLGSGH